MKKYILRIVLLMISIFFLQSMKLEAKPYLSGRVFTIDKGQQEFLVGANVYWIPSLNGTTTDKNGFFELGNPVDGDQMVVISFVGFQPDTIHVQSKGMEVEVQLVSTVLLEEATISARQSSNALSQLDPKQANLLTEAELTKAACCNLAESFETNASVDVSYSDAVTGARQIKMLGLVGKYTQIMMENMPIYSGMAAPFGLEYIPGSWMESIYISKGASSVLNGYESVTGQINVEFKKPNKAEKFYLNIYGNDNFKLEANAYSGIIVNDKWSTLTAVHWQQNKIASDHNDDGFMDHPLVNQSHLLHRWKYVDTSLVAQIGFGYLTEERVSGEMDFDPITDAGTNNNYGVKLNTDRLLGFLKTGYIFKRPNTSVGFINNVALHQQNGDIGLKAYDGEQFNWNSNLIFHTFIGNFNHDFSTGLSFKYDNFFESLNSDSTIIKERVPGAFFEYNFKGISGLIIQSGIRADLHNIFGLLISPRMHIKYDLNDHYIARLSAGRSHRNPYVYAENLSLLALSRDVKILEQPRMEVAWTFGSSISRHGIIKGREYDIVLEYFRTQFENQLVIDRETNSDNILIYNLDGQSFANHIQIEFHYELLPQVDLVLAARASEVKTTINGNLKKEPLIPAYKGLANLSYKTENKKWQADYTAQFNGKSRYPDLDFLPTQYQLPDESPAYTIMNAQLTRSFRKWSVYLGGENLTNFKQEDPIIAADDPFGSYFDATQIWGPILGRKIYAGVKVFLK